MSAPEATRQTQRSTADNSQRPPYPRWVVASGLIVYSVLFWGVLIGVVSGATKWFTPQPVDVAGEPTNSTRLP